MRIAASLSSPHVVAVLEIGDESAAFPYLAMELLDGQDLAQVLRERERLAPEAVLDLVRQVGAGLRVAHAAGIIHRDLKPQNLFLTGTTWKILDFGVSKVLDGGTVTEGLAVGTPAYMAPEQARGEDVAEAADLYGLGAVAYRAITGRAPFSGTDAREILVSLMMEMPVCPSTLVPVPKDVDLALALALAKEPADRFASADAVASALESAFANRLDPKLRSKATELLAKVPWREPTESKPAPRR